MLSALWSFGRHREKPVAFEHVHLPDDGKEFLKPPLKMLLQELEGASASQQKEALAHFRMGEERFKTHQYRDAAEFYQASYRVFGSLSALLARGVALMMVSELKEAAKVFEEGRNLSQTRKAIRLEAAFGINLGQVCNDLGEPDRSRKALKGARVLCREIEDTFLEVMALRHLGMIFLAQALYNEAMACCEEAIQISEEIKDKISVGHILCNKAVILVSKGNLNDAEEIFQQGLMLGRELEDPYIQGRIYTNLANLDLIRRRVQEATSALERALDIHRSISYGQGEVRNLGELAVIQIGQGNLEKGHRTFEQAIEIAYEIEYRRGIIWVNFIYAKMQLAHSNFDCAVQLFQTAFSLAEDLGCKHLQIEIYSTLAIFDLDIKRKISVLQNVLQQSQNICSTILEIYILNQLSIVSINAGNNKNALQYCHQATILSRKIGNFLQEAQSLMNVAYIQEKQGEKERAAESVSMAQALFQSQGIQPNDPQRNV